MAVLENGWKAHEIGQLAVIGIGELLSLFGEQMMEKFMSLGSIAELEEVNRS